MSVAEFCALASPSAFDVAAHTLLLSDVLLNGQRYRLESETPLEPFAWQYGICGVGAICSNAQKLVTALFSTKEPLNTFVQLNVESQLSSEIERLLGARPPWLNDVSLFGVTLPEPQLSTGDAVACRNPGSAGCNVRWPGGTGFLTAGHVAGPSQVPFYSGQQIGFIVYSNDPNNHGTQIEADVALVELNPGVAMTNPFNKSSVAGPNAVVRPVSHKHAGRRGPQTNVRAVAPWFYAPTLQGTWGDVYLTTGVVTQSGDSGAPVVDAADAIIGHVVGAMTGVGTLVQNVHYQISVLNREVPFAGNVVSQQGQFFGIQI